MLRERKVYECSCILNSLLFLEKNKTKHSNFCTLVSFLLDIVQCFFTDKTRIFCMQINLKLLYHETITRIFLFQNSSSFQYACLKLGGFFFFFFLRNDTISSSSIPEDWIVQVLTYF